MTIWTHIVDGIIVDIGNRPLGADAGGQWLEPLTDANAHLAGYFPVTETPRPADTDTTTHDRTVELVNGVPTVVWTPRAWTADEQTARQADTNRTTVDAAITAALAELQSIIDAPAVDTVPAGTLTTAQLSQGLRVLRDAVQANRAGTKRLARTLRHVVRYTRGDFDGTD